jgi:hypothetical protein
LEADGAAKLPTQARIVILSSFLSSGRKERSSYMQDLVLSPEGRKFSQSEKKIEPSSIQDGGEALF